MIIITIFKVFQLRKLSFKSCSFIVIITKIFEVFSLFIGKQTKMNRKLSKNVFDGINRWREEDRKYVSSDEDGKKLNRQNRVDRDQPSTSKGFNRYESSSQSKFFDQDQPSTSKQMFNKQKTIYGRGSNVNRSDYQRRRDNQEMNGANNYDYYSDNHIKNTPSWSDKNSIMINGFETFGERRDRMRVSFEKGEEFMSDDQYTFKLKTERKRLIARIKTLEKQDPNKSMSDRECKQQISKLIKKNHELESDLENERLMKSNEKQREIEFWKHRSDIGKKVFENMVIFSDNLKGLQADMSDFMQTVGKKTNMYVKNGFLTPMFDENDVRLFSHEKYQKFREFSKEWSLPSRNVQMLPSWDDFSKIPATKTKQLSFDADYQHGFRKDDFVNDDEDQVFEQVDNEHDNHVKSEEDVNEKERDILVQNSKARIEKYLVKAEKPGSKRVADIVGGPFSVIKKSKYGKDGGHAMIENSDYPEKPVQKVEYDELIGENFYGQGPGLQGHGMLQVHDSSDDEISEKDLREISASYDKKIKF